MPNSILELIENYKDNRDNYTAEERKILRESVRVELRKAGKSVCSSLVGFIDKINQE